MTTDSAFPWLRHLTPRRIDLVVVAIVLAWALPNVPWRWNLPGHSGSPGEIVGYSLFTVAITAPLWWRRRYPVLVAGVEVALLVLRVALGRNVVASVAAVVIACYGLAVHITARRWILPLAGITFVAALVLVASGYELRETGLVLVLIGTALMTGDAAAARRAEHETTVENAKLAERARIARDLHDVMAHQLSAIAVQAGAARLASAADGQTSAAPLAALRTIEQLSRDALDQLSQLLGVLRHGEGEAPSRQPSPTLSDVEALIDSARRVGTPVTSEMRGDRGAVSATVALGVYRLVQESLTNVSKHAPGSSTTVSIDITPRGADVKVVNEAPSNGSRRVAWPVDGGRGIVGMRERAEALGGEFAAGPTTTGGFAVSARHLSDRRSGLSDEVRL
ncbi:MAG: sensor histidine kinase [Ilumatobacteraceae bacterium]